MREPRILFVTGEYPPQSGGVGDYTALLGQALERAGLCVRVITDIRVDSGDYSEDYPQSYPQIENWGWGSIGQILRFAEEFEADWIHVQYQTAAFDMHPAINTAPFFWRRKGYRVAWTYHDLRVPYLFPKAGAFLRRQTTLLPARSAHLSLVTNEGDRRTLSQLGMPHHMIPIGSNIGGRKLSPEERRRQRSLRGYRESDLVLGFFGFLNPEKGGEILIDVLAHLTQVGRDAHLLMIGERIGASDPIHGSYLAQFESRIDEAGLKGRVLWTGRQPEEGVSADLNAIDLLLLPYRGGMSLSHGTLMAGLSNGCAIVTSAPEHPIPELEPGRDLVIVPAGDAQAASAAVLALIDDEKRIAQLRENARRASRQFRWESIASAHIGLYNNEIRDQTIVL